MVTATFDLSVRADSARLDYGVYKALNEKAGVYLGVLSISFADARRQEPEIAVWKDLDGQQVQANILIEDYDLAILEGRKKLATHLVAERDTRLADQKKKSVLAKKHKLECEACGTNLTTAYDGNGSSACEVHHLIPLARGATKVSMRGLAVLCANCHRVLHSLKPLPTSIAVFKKIALGG